MAKYVDVVFDKSPNNGPGSTSICRDCCQILSTRTCTGEIELSANGCRFHKKHPDVPFAVRSTITSVRLRDMLRPSMAMVFFYIDPGETDLMDVGWVKQIREDNEVTSRPRKLYQHGETCLHGTDPRSIIQGRGVEGIYWKRCDGRYVNALGEDLQLDALMADDPEPESVEHDIETDEKKLAELAWRRHNPGDSDEDEEEQPKRKFHCMVM
jgi:hypothetical protein